MDIVTLLIVGLVAGVLASFAIGGVGYGILGDIGLGIVGAFVGSWLFTVLKIGVPFNGIAGTIFVAFVGALVVLVLVRALRRGQRG